MADRHSPLAVSSSPPNGRDTLNPVLDASHQPAHEITPNYAHHSDADVLSSSNTPASTLNSVFTSDVSSSDPLLSTSSVPMVDGELLNSAMGIDPAPGFLPDFPPPLPPFAMDSHADVMSADLSSSVTTPSSDPSLASSPGLHSMSSGFMSSSLATALDGSAVSLSHNRSGSMGSPHHATEMAFMAAVTGPTMTDSGFHFPTSSFDVRVPVGSLDSPADLASGTNLIAVRKMLQNIARTAQSAQEACTLGQGTQAGIQIDELKKTIALVADLIANTRLDAPISPPHVSSSRSSSSLSPPHYNAIPSPLPQMGQYLAPQPDNSLGSFPMDVQNGDLGDSSRKRCASSLPGDRVVKALKREPQDDLAGPQVQAQLSNLSAPQPPLFPQANGIPSLAVPPLPVSLPAVIDASSLTAFIHSNPPSEPPSRPGSAGGLSSHTLAMMQQHASPHRPSSFPIPLNISSSTTQHSSFPPHPAPHPTWIDSTGVYQPHALSLSMVGMTSAIVQNGHGMGMAAPSSSSPTFGSPSYTTPPHTQTLPTSSSSNSPLSRAVRATRSSSMSNPFGYTSSERDSYRHVRKRSAVKSAPHSPDSSSHEHEGDSDSGGHSPPPERRDSSRDSVGGQVPMTGQSQDQTHSSAESPMSAMSGNDVPQEYRAEVDRIFFEFLIRICSNLDATDAKGEPIHQTLMAKKMQRLDESPDFRPFKFRIQAFTNAFLEELSRQGYPEERIPMKKIRTYLWSQQYISRFNEDGKKAKSKGNHIWNIDAKKTADGGWIFRPFHRKLAGSPPSVAYVGLRWSWAPRIWDPQASRANVPVHYSSPSLPSWLSWHDEVLSGVPPADAQSGDVTAEARFMQDDREVVLSQKVHITIAPISTGDLSFAGSRRPSLAGETNDPRRTTSDTAITQTTALPPRPTNLLRSQTSGGPALPVSTQDVQVIQVLTSAAQRVAQEAQSQVVASSTPCENGPDLQALAKQQHVLTVTAHAFDQEVQRPDDSSPASNVLAAAAQQVVLQAALQVAADHSATAAIEISAGIRSIQEPNAPVTVNEVSVATQSAVAQAVEITGPLSSEVDVMMTASSLLQQQSRSPPSTLVLDASQLVSPLDTLRPVPTGVLSANGYGMTSMGAHPAGAMRFPTSDPLLSALDMSTHASHS